MSRFRVWLAFAVLSLIWGSSFLFIRIAVEQISPLAVVALRLLFGAAGITVIALVRRTPLRLNRRDLAVLCCLAIANTVAPFILITWGEQTITSGLAAVLNSTTPIFSLLIAHLALHDEPITLPRLGGVAIGFLGVVVLLSRDLAEGGIHWSGVAGQGAVVLASAFYALSAVLTRRTVRHLSSMTIATYALWFSCAQALVISLIFSPPPLTTIHFSAVFATAWLGVLGSAIAYVCYYYIIQTWGASRATLVTYVVPAIALVLGALFLGEVVDWRIVAGSALIILGVGLASIVRRPLRAAQSAGQRHTAHEEAHTV